MTFEIITSRGFYKRIKWLAILLGPFVLLALLNAYHAFFHPSQESERFTMGFAMLGVGLMVALGPIFPLVARRWWVHRFDAQGVVLRSGRRFYWKDFQKIEPRIMQRWKTVNNYDLVFTTGTAGIYHLMAENSDELWEIIRELEAGKNRFTA
jgi:hypothetical protein